LLEDARPQPPVRIAATVGLPRAVSADGRRALGAFMHLPQNPQDQPRSDLRLFDLSDGRQLAELPIPLIFARRFALSADGSQMALVGLDAPFPNGIQILDLPGGRESATLAGLTVPAPPLGGLSDSVLAFSPDGRYLAVARGDGKKSDVVLWDLREPAASRHLARVDVPVFWLSFRPDGRLLAFPAGGNKLALAGVRERGEPKLVELPLPVAPQAIDAGFALRLSGDRLAWGLSSPVLAVACTDPAGKLAILFWDVERLAEVGRWDAGFELKMLRMAMSPGGKRLAVGHGDGTVRVYDLAARGEAYRLEAAHPGGVGMLSWLADGRLLAADLFGNAYTFWEPSDPPPASVIAPGGATVGDLGFSPDGLSLAVLRGGPQPTVALVERDSGRAGPPLTLPAKLTAGALCFRPDGRQLAAVGTGQAVVWDLPGGGDKTYSLPGRAGWFPQTSYRPTFLADGRLLITEQHIQGGEVRFAVRDFVSGQEFGPGVKATLSQAPALLAVAARLSADGRRLVSVPASFGTSPDPIIIWDVQSGERVGEMTHPDLGTGAVAAMMAGLSLDGQWLYHPSHPSGGLVGLDVSQMRVRVWDVANRRHHCDIPVSAEPSEGAISRDGGLLAIGYENGSVEVWDVRAKEELFQWRPTGARKIRPLAFTPDADFLACGDERGVVQMLHLGELRRRLADMGLDW
jgi:WD40 repeat protein